MVFKQTIFARGARSADAMCRAAFAKRCAKVLKIKGHISFFEFSFGPLLAPTWAGSFSSSILIAYSGLIEITKSIIKPLVFLHLFASGARLEMRRVGNEVSKM